MITLTPSGDILLEGLGKVGEYNIILSGLRWHINTKYGTIGSCTNYLLNIKYHITHLLTNGFTPKKWEE